MKGDWSEGKWWEGDWREGSELERTYELFPA